MGSKSSGGASSNSNNSGFSSQTSTFTPSPEALAAYRRALSMAENVTSQKFQPYTGQLVAGFTPDTMNAMQGVRDMQGIYNPYGNAATQLTQQAVDYSDPRNFNASSLAQYENPYNQQVVNATMANLGQLQAEADQSANSKAALNGTFNGSGAWLGRAEVARQRALANAQTLAGLNQSNYQQAVNQFNSQQQQAIATAQNAAYGLGQLGQQAQNAALQGVNALMSSGNSQQALAQKQLDGAYSQYLAAQAFPYQQAAFYSGIAGGIAPNMGGTTNSSGFNVSNSQQQQSGGGGMGAGLFTSALSMLPSLFSMSDRDDKTDIKYLGKDPDSGEKLYAYRYKDDPKSYPKVVGPMAQDIQRHSPERVHEVGGHKIVRNRAADGGVQAGFGALTQDPSAVNNFVQGIFDPQTADQLARAKWVNQSHELGEPNYTGDNYVIPPSLMDNGYGYPDMTEGYAPRAQGGRMPGFGELMRQQPYGGGAAGFIPDPSDFNVRPASDAAVRHATESGISTVKHALSDHGGGGGGGEGGGAKMPELKLPKPSTKKAASTPGETPAPEATPGVESQPDSKPAEGPAAPVDLTRPDAMGPVGEIAPIGDWLNGLGFGGLFASRGGAVNRHHREGGGALGAGGGTGFGPHGDVGGVTNAVVGGNAYGPQGEDSDSGLTLGQLVLGKAKSPSEAAGFGNIRAAQESMTGEKLLGKWNAERHALHGTGPQLTPVQQGMPAMPDEAFYSKPRADLPSVSATQHYGEQNPGLDTNVMAMAGAGAGKSGQMLGPIAFGLAGSTAAQNAAASAKQAELKATREAMLADPANFPVQGYFQSLGSNEVNPDTGLFNINYTGAYRGYPYKDGGRVNLANGGLSEAEQDMVLRTIPAIIAAESGGNPSAKNRSSSAGGLGQFTNSTWLHWARQTNPALANLPDKQVLRLKTDASPQGMAFQRATLHNFTLDNAARLKAAGHPVTPENLYTVHFSGNTNMAGASPNMKLARVMDRAARAANPSIARMTRAQLDQHFLRHMPDANVARVPSAQSASAGDQPMGSTANKPLGYTQGETRQPPAPFDKMKASTPAFNPVPTEVPTSIPNSEAGLSRAEQARIATQAAREAAANRSQFARDFNHGRGPMNEPPRPAPVAPPTSAPASLGDLQPTAPTGLQMPHDAMSPPPLAPTGIGGDPRQMEPRDLMGAKPMSFGDMPMPEIAQEAPANETPRPPMLSDAPLEVPATTPRPVQPVRVPSAAPTRAPAPARHTPIPAYAPKEPQMKPDAFMPRHRAAPVHERAQPQQTDPFANDPIKGFFRDLFGPSADAGAAATPQAVPSEQPMQLASAENEGGNGFFGGLIPEGSPVWEGGDLFAASRGGFVRHHFAEGGEADFDPLGAVGDALSGVGDALSNGFGALAQNNGQEAVKQPAPTDTKPQQTEEWSPKFTWSPLQTALLSAGLGMMASRNPNTAGAIGEGGLMGLNAYFGAKELEDDEKAAAEQERQLKEVGKLLYPETPPADAPQKNAQAPNVVQQALKLTASQDVDPRDFATRPVQLAMNDTGVMSDAPTPGMAAAARQPFETQAASLESKIAAANQEYQRAARVAAAYAANPQAYRMATMVAQMHRNEAAAARDELARLQARENQRRDANKLDVMETGVNEFGDKTYVYRSGPHQGEAYVPPGQTVMPQADWSKTGEDFLKTLPQDMQYEVKSLAEGRAAMPRQTPQGQRLWKMVTHYDPSFDEGVYKARKDMRTEYASQKGTAPGLQITAGNTAIGHAGELSDLILKLGNLSDVDLINKPINWVREHWGDEAAQTLNKYRSLADKYVDEQTTFYKGKGGGSVDERREARERLDPNKGPKVLLQTLMEDQRAMGSKIAELEESWDRTMGKGQSIPIEKYDVIRKHGKEGQEQLERNWRIANGEEAPAPVADQAALDALLAKYPHLTHEQLREIYEKLEPK